MPSAPAGALLVDCRTTTASKVSEPLMLQSFVSLQLLVWQLPCPSPPSWARTTGLKARTVAAHNIGMRFLAFIRLRPGLYRMARLGKWGTHPRSSGTPDQGLQITHLTLK